MTKIFFTTFLFELTISETTKVVAKDVFVFSMAHQVPFKHMTQFVFFLSTLSMKKFMFSCGFGF